jgi:sigma-54 dependent transcriptional regulator, acetoin dehydrogenase operon transcriptional activator AcoR
VGVRCDWRSRDGHRPLHAVPHAPVAVSIPPVERPDSTTSLRETEHQAIVQALAEHGGNVSKTARVLGVSRGRVYRHLRADSGQPRVPVEHGGPDCTRLGAVYTLE